MTGSDTSDESSVSPYDETDRCSTINGDINNLSDPILLGVGGLEVPHEKEEFRRVLTPLSKDQLVELLAGACIENPQTLQRVLRVICESRSHRRLYVKNLPFSASTESLIDLFSRFGDVEEGIVLKKDGKSRGYAFVTYKTIESALLACKNPIMMNGRFLMVKLAADPFPFEAKRSDIIRRKLFVRNLGFETNEDSLSAVLGQYGELEESVILRTKKGQSKGYGFVTFASPESTIRALQQPHHLVDGRLVFVHQAVEGKTRSSRNKEVTNPNSARQILGEIKNPDFKNSFQGFCPYDSVSSQQYSRRKCIRESVPNRVDWPEEVALYEYDMNRYSLKHDHRYLSKRPNSSLNIGNYEISENRGLPDNCDLEILNSNESDTLSQKLNISGRLLPATSNTASRYEVLRTSIDLSSLKSVHNSNYDDSSERNSDILADGNSLPLTRNRKNSEFWGSAEAAQNHYPYVNLHVRAPKSWLPLNTSENPWLVSEESSTEMRTEWNTSGARYYDLGNNFKANIPFEELIPAPLGESTSWDVLTNGFTIDTLGTDCPFIKSRNNNKRCDRK
ncbi:putative RNA-binding protein musashi [Cryptosporidium felis]|nr:putative RNA-binding protein musashi [Cryptosporidium felis]